MEKIPVPPYRTYLNKYKTISVSELVVARVQIEKDRDDAVYNWTQLQLNNGTRDEEYEAYIKARNLNAELETLTSVLNIKRIEEDSE